MMAITLYSTTEAKNNNVMEQEEAPFINVDIIKMKSHNNNSFRLVYQGASF